MMQKIKSFFKRLEEIDRADLTVALLQIANIILMFICVAVSNDIIKVCCLTGQISLLIKMVLIFRNDSIKWKKYIEEFKYKIKDYEKD